MEENTAKAMALSLLPEDVLLEILVRVTPDAPSLFRCATACKWFSCLISDDSFLWRCWPDQDSSSSFVGFFFTPPQNHQVPVREPCFVPTPRSPLGPGRRALGSFLTATPAGFFDKAVPLASRHGLLLVLIEADETGGCFPDPIIVHLQLAVCNLLVGTCDILPPLRYPSAVGDIELCGYAILTGVDCRSHDDDDESSPSSVIPPGNVSGFFKVAIVAFNYEDLTYTIHTFSSDKGRWNAHTDCSASTVHVEEYGLFGNAIVRRGTAHWQFSGYDSLYILNMNTQTDHISLTRLPFLRDSRLTSPESLTLGVNRMLSLLLIQNAGSQIEIQEQQEDQRRNVAGTNNSKWLCTRKMELKQPWEATEGRKLRIMGEKCGTILVHDNYDHVYTTDLETGRMEVLDWSRKCCLNPWKIVPLTMAWPTIFLSRLSVRYS